MHLNEVCTCLSAFVIGGVTMSQKFNQQPLEHTHSGDILSHDSYQHQNLTPYSNEVPKRKDFVVSFITGAIIGSTIGLLYKNKGFEKIDELKKKEQELEQKYLNIKEQAETNFNAIKSKIEDFKQQDSISPDEIAAQQQAIKEEVNDTLKDDSPEAQEIQQAKAEAKEENKKEASATEIAAQQQAIKHETNDALKDDSPEAQEIQQAKAEAQEENKKEASATEIAAQQQAIKHETNDALKDDSPEAQEIQQAKAEAKEENKKEASATEIAAQQQAIKHETNDTLKAPSNKTKKMMVNNQAQRLAQAAKGKAQKMEQDSSVTAKTKALLTEPELKFVKVERVPNLVTKPSINQPEAQIKDQQTHQSAHFDNGVITHEEKSIQQDNSTKNERKSTPKQAQRVEKAKSKIDKRTFND